MARVGRWLLVAWIAAAVWISDRWLWTLPTLAGVMASVRLSHLQRRAQRGRLSPADPATWLIVALILASFLYLYLLCLVLHLTELLDPEAMTSPSVAFAAAGSLVLAGVLAGILFALGRQRRTPEWFLRLWAWLVEER